MIANSYAAALYELGISREDIHEAQRILNENPLLLCALSSPVISAEEKRRVADAVFEPGVRSFVKVVCDNGCCDSFNDIFEAYDSYYRRKKRILKASLRYVTPPDERQTDGIKELLKKKHNMDSVELEMQKDSSLIGGFVITAQNVEYDRSVKTRLKYIKETLIK